MSASRPTRHGPWMDTGGEVHFALWAPDASQVALQVGGQSYPMARDDDGFFSLWHSMGSHNRYRFLINDSLSVPDPASRWQPRGVHGDSALPASGDYPWRCHDWQGRPWHESVIYEVHAGLAGGFDGLRGRLADLKALGITALQLMPVGSFPGRRNWGYDSVLPFAPADAYGTPQALQALIDDAHALGLMVFIDVVYNHFGPEGNWLPHYAGAFFDARRDTPWGPAINFDHPVVRAFFLENALMWLCDYRADGLRLDAAHAIDNEPFLVWLAARIREHTGPDRHVHLMLENEHNSASLLRHGYDAQWNDDTHHILHTLLTGEHEGYYRDFQQQPTASLARTFSEGFIYQGQSTPTGRRRGQPSGDLSPQSFIVFLQNHDQIGNRARGERLLSLASPDAVQCAFAALLLSPMIPMLFMGEEHGEQTPFYYFTDYQGELAQQVREGRRREFRQFSDFQGTLPDPNDPDTCLACCPLAWRRSDLPDNGWEAFCRHLLLLRQATLIPVLPGSHSLGTEVLGEGAIAARWRLADGDTLLMCLNLSDRTTRLPALGDTALLFSHGGSVEALRAGQLAAPAIAVFREVAP